MSRQQPILSQGMGWVHGSGGGVGGAEPGQGSKCRNCTLLPDKPEVCMKWANKSERAVGESVS